MGDFNSHSPSWGYPDLGSKGEEVEDWIIINQMVLINHPDDPHTYYSRAWRTTSCPDLAIATYDVAKITRYHVDQQLGGSDHKPVILHKYKAVSKLELQESKLDRFQAKADQYCKDLDLGQHHLNNKVKLFVTAILTAAT